MFRPKHPVLVMGALCGLSTDVQCTKMLPLLPGAYNISGEALEPATAQQHFTAFPFSPRVSSLESAPRKPAYITAPQTARKEERRQSGLSEHPAFAKRCVMHAAANHQQPTTFLLIQFHFISFLLEHHKRREPFNASKAFKVFGRLSLSSPYQAKIFARGEGLPAWRRAVVCKKWQTTGSRFASLSSLVSVTHAFLR